MQDHTTPTPGIAAGLIGQHVIVRATNAGVHAGILSAQNGTEVLLTNARRLWYWHAAKGHSLNGVAAHGLNAAKSKIPAAVAQIVIYDACEIIAITADAQSSIDAVPAYEP